VDVAVDLARRREDQRQPEPACVLEDVERHDRVLERAVRLADELMHLCVRGEMDDDVDPRVLDAADPSREGRVVAREVLEQRRELVGPRVHALVDAEHVVAVALEADTEVRADLAGGARDQDAHERQS
jgi:hypothetical protein